jgi:hypothetical protein
MQPIRNIKGEKLHTRRIETSTYECGDGKIIVQGSLCDERFQDSHTVTGEMFPEGVIHHMSVSLLIDCTSLVIEDIDVELTSVPREVCLETIDCLARIRGLAITRGFTQKVKNIAGGKKGCAHLVELIQAMAPAAFQGFAAYRSREPSGFSPDAAKAALKMLVNTCHAWREGGPLAEMISKKTNP